MASTEESMSLSVSVANAAMALGGRLGRERDKGEVAGAGPVSSADSPRIARGTQSQSRRLKITYKPAQTTPIRPIAKGYPKLQLSSGMCLKFMP